MSQTQTTTKAAAAGTLLPAISDEEIYTIDELIKRRATELQDAPLLGFPKEGVVDYEEHSARAVDKYADAAAEALRQRGLQSVDGNLEKAPVVGILSHSGLHVIMTMLGLSRLGYAVLLLSTRLASPAITRLLELADCNTLLTTDNFHPVLTEVQKERQLQLLELLVHSDYYGVDAPLFTRSYDKEKETRKNAIIIHSSGSTGLPKPIYLTHRSCIAAFATNLDMRALITSPMFHSHCFYETFRSIYSGKPIYYCNYTLPLTRQNLIAMIEHVKPDLLHSVPYVIKLLAESEEGIRTLASVKLVLFAGSACPDDLGDKLVRNSVNLVGNYGATETGRLANSVRPPGDDAWNYMRFLPSAKPYVLMDEIAPGIYECVALDGLRSKSTINSDDPPKSFRTRDLFTRHPTRPDLWKYVSRLDDRFTLVNGEKVLPIPIEGRIRQEEIVKEAVVFGEGKSVPGALIIKADRVSHVSDEEFLRDIWPAVKDANSRAESFSHIPKELIVVLPSDTVYPRTDKGTFIRAQMYAQFKAEIEAAYTNFENEEGGTIALETSELEGYLIQKFREHIGVELESSETDFFASGIDSLQCIRMWNLMKKELDLGGRQSELGQNILYETGNVKELANYLYLLRAGKTGAAKDEQRVMNDLIDKYSSFTSFQKEIPKTEVVLLTGVTGGLGAHLLAQLVSKPNVSAVWAPVRASSDTAALARVLESLEARGIRLSLTERSKIIAFSSDLSKQNFGLEASELETLRSKLTLAIHSAWAVNFNISVQSFEDQHIKATHNLIEFCQSVPHASPAQFFYCSSVSAAGGTPRPGTVAEGPVDNISHVQGTGYARSKYVTEHIVRNAARDAGAATRVLRVGQLVGDSKTGEWNATEGIPMMIQTAVTLGALPTLDEEMTWLPVDYAARIILDLTHINNLDTADTKSNHDLVYHVLNPRRFHWTREMLPALTSAFAHLNHKFDIVSPEEWMQRLRASNRDPTKNPPIKLLDWFESKYGYGAPKTKPGPLVYETTKTAKDSKTLSSIPDVTDKEFVKMMVESLWKKWHTA